MNELSLFTGAGGGLLGTILLGWEIACGVEIDPYCREVLLRRQEEGILPPFPVWDDIRTFDGSPWRGLIDIITAGFPCQPFSVAGQQKGKDDERNLWPETARVIREVRPRYCFLENVPGLLVHEYFGEILKDLAESGYDCRWDCISASAVGAPHRRDRLWILAYPSCIGRRGRDNDDAQGQGGTLQTAGSCPRDQQGDVANTCRTGRKKREGEPGNNEQKQPPTERGRSEWWDIDPADIPNSKGKRWSREVESRKDVEHDRQESPHGSSEAAEGTTESFVGRVAHGVANRVDRLKAIGNGQVPEVVRVAWELLTGGG